MLNMWNKLHTYMPMWCHINGMLSSWVVHDQYDGGCEIQIKSLNASLLNFCFNRGFSKLSMCFTKQHYFHKKPFDIHNLHSLTFKILKKSDNSMFLIFLNFRACLKFMNILWGINVVQYIWHLKKKL
jgi:hypothetical protein